MNQVRFDWLRHDHCISQAPISKSQFNSATKTLRGGESGKRGLDELDEMGRDGTDLNG